MVLVSVRNQTHTKRYDIFLLKFCNLLGYFFYHSIIVLAIGIIFNAANIELALRKTV